MQRANGTRASEPSRWSVVFIVAILAPTVAAACGDKFSAAEPVPRDGAGGESGEGGEAGKADGGSTGEGASGRGGSSMGGSSGGGRDSGTNTAGNGGEAGTGPAVPSTCDPTALEDGCIPADTAIYVSTDGNDENDGTAGSPLASIGAAVTQAASSGAPIFVCGGSYDEHVVVSDDGIGIHGGFACPAPGTAWVYDSTMRARIAPSTPGYALHVSSASGITVTDLELESADAEMPGESSIAVFVSSSDDVVFSRVTIIAGDGVKGADGTRGDPIQTTNAVTGRNATNNVGGAAAICECSDGTTSIGGRGGSGGLSPGGGSGGLPDAGAGQGGTVGTCSTGGTGGDGGNASPSPDGPGAALLGTLSTSAWTPSSGEAGADGTPGQGGGGGAGAATGGGGGGACGGCGGRGGGSGGGGGGSIGLAAFRSNVTLTRVDITTGAAGDGGSGIEGELGESGGIGGTRSGLACNGGNGGDGADGASGGGGAGGISVGVLYSVDSTITISRTTTSNLGPPGAGGPAAMGSMNAGIAGVAVDALEVS